MLVALSGGADSLMLCRALLPLRDEAALTISAIHIHHGLRQASDEEETFVRSFCETQGLSLSVKRLRMKGKSNLEARARELRYQAFREALREGEADVLALGHHMDDQAETMLMRMMKGSGATGLSAMRELSGRLWRPMLSVRKQEIRDALTELSQAWREDESNAEPVFQRNALRLQIMPALESISPGATRGMARSALILQDEEDYWQGMASAWLHQHASTRAPCYFLLADPCLDLHIAAQRRVLRMLCGAAGISCAYEHIERLIALLNGSANSQDNLPGDAHALRSRHRLHILPKGTQPAPIGQLAMLPGPAAYQARDALQQALDLDAIEGAILRFRQPGDRILPLGAGGSKPLSEYLTDRLLDRPFRDHWPVLAKGQDVLWVPKIGISQKAAISAKTDRAGLVRYLGRLPDQLDHEDREGDDHHEGT